MAFPTGLDSFPRPNATDALDSPSHTDVHNLLADAIEALETKLGLEVSNAADSLVGYVLTRNSLGTGWEAVPADVDTVGGGGDLVTVDVQVIVRASGSYTWTKPANALLTEVILIGGGGGGGGGGDESSDALGGSGGGGGGMSRRLFRSSDLGATEHTEPGQGGSGAGIAFGGSNGSTGGNSYFGADHLTSPQNAKLTAGGGIGGAAGVSSLTRQNGAAPGFGNQASAIGRWDHNDPTAHQYLPFFSGGSSASPQDFYSTGSSDYYCGGGGAGGGLHSASGIAGASGGAPVEQGGGASGDNGPFPFSTYAPGGTVGAGQNGTNGHTITSQALYYGGYGGGGGAGRQSGSSSAGKGGNGSLYGGGGGGGGGGNSIQSVFSGAGGDGGDGVVVVITLCVVAS